MKKKTVFGSIIAFVSMAMIFTFVSCGSSPSYSPPSSPPLPSPKWENVILTGEQEPMLEGTTWDYISTGHDFLLKYEFRAGGRMVQDRTAISRKDGSKWEAQGALNNNSWQREGDIIKLTFNNGFTYAEGKYYPDTKKIMGLAEDSYGDKEDFTMSPVGNFTPPPSLVAGTSPSPSYSDDSSSYSGGSSSSGSSSSGSSGVELAKQITETINNTFQPPLDNGTYRTSGGAEQIVFAGIARGGNISYKDAEGTTHRGTYSIDDTRLTINVMGRSYFYTITSKTSFSGNGESWFRVGF